MTLQNTFGRCRYCHQWLVQCDETGAVYCGCEGFEIPEVQSCEYVDDLTAQTASHLCNIDSTSSRRMRCASNSSIQRHEGESNEDHSHVANPRGGPQGSSLAHCR